MLVTIDEALAILHRTGPELAGGNSNHDPMVAEALYTLGRPDLVMPWIEGYKSRCAKCACEPERSGWARHGTELVG